MALFKDKRDFTDTVADTVANVKFRIQPEAAERWWNDKSGKPRVVTAYWMFNRLFNALFQIDRRGQAQGRSLSALSRAVEAQNKLINDRTLTDAQRAELTKQIEDATREAAYEGAQAGTLDVAAEDVAGQLEVVPK